MTNSNLTFPQKSYHFRTDFKLECEIRFENLQLVCQVHKRKSISEAIEHFQHIFYFPADSACHGIEFQLGTGCYWIRRVIEMTAEKKYVKIVIEMTAEKKYVKIKSN